MAVKMDPVIIRRKIAETTDMIARMEKEGECPEMIQIEKRKLMVLHRWLEDAEKAD